MPEQTSIWKKEIHLGRPRLDDAVEAVSESAPAERQEVATPAENESIWKKEFHLGSAPGDHPSFSKKELSLGRSVKPKVERAPKPASQPFWKREITLGRSSKARTKGAPKRASRPLLKRELRLSRPKLPGRGGVQAGSGVVKLVGLRIGSSQLAAALVNNNGSAELLQLARTPLERGVVVAGEVRDPEALGQALKRFFAANKLPRRSVRLGVATNRIGVRVIEVPAIDDPKLLANAIRFRAQEVLPIPLTEAVLDHVVLGETVDARGGKQHRVLVVFAHRELVDGYLDACKRAGLKLHGIDFDAFALLRALSGTADEPAEKPAALVAVSIGHERTVFAVSEGSVCDFARVLEWGGSSLDAALARALDIPVEHAERVKQTLVLTGDQPAGELSADQLEAARTAARDELQVLARELVSSLQFYQARPGSLDIGEVLLTGGGAQLAGIDAELARQLGVFVRMGDPLRGVTLGNKVSRPADAGSLAIAVGLGIEG